MTGEWVAHEAGDESWDDLLARSSDASIFQTAAWARHKRAEGWESLRWVLRQGTEVAGAVQILVWRAGSRLRVAWAPGGPVLGFPSLEAETLVAAVDGLVLRLSALGSLVYVRLDPYVPRTAPFAYAFARALRRPVAFLTPSFSLILDVSRTLDERLATMDAKHRYYVRKALAEPITWRAANGAEVQKSLLVLDDAMRRERGVRLAPLGREVLRRLCDAFGDDAVILVGETEGKPVAACLALASRCHAYYLRAAQNERGRTLSAAYAMVARLADVLGERGVTRLDLGGIDPSPRFAGLAHFKRGFGGTLVERLGEWEWSTTPWLRGLAWLGVRGY